MSAGQKPKDLVTPRPAWNGGRVRVLQEDSLGGETERELA